MRVLAYAKLNLTLRVLGRRQDGFHEIDSTVQTISLADRLTIEVQAAGVDVENDLDLEPALDLAGQAASLLLREKGVSIGARVQVHKTIPVGAGLGGGSSDAAAVLAGLNQLTSPPLSCDRLALLAEHLGADVPLFLQGGRLRVGGRGERVVPLPASQRKWFVVLVPPIHCSTPLVYERFDRLARITCRSQGSPESGSNDLEQAALELYPELAPYRRALGGLEMSHWGMSGSGSAFFAAFDEETRAQAARLVLERSLPQARVFVAIATDCGHKLGGDPFADRD